MASSFAPACETRRKLTTRPVRRAVARFLVLAAFAAFLALPLTAAAQTPEPPREGAAPAAAQAPAAGAGREAAAEREAAGESRSAGEHAAAAEHGEQAAGGEHGEAEEHHGRGIIDDIARLVNFLILAGTLVYFLRAPLRTYLADRGTQIRGDLVNAAETRKTATAQIAEIEQKMRALPGELEALRAQGAQEIAAEEARISAAATAERERLLEQARREIEMRTRIAERDLVAHAGELAVGVAAERIKKTITDADQQRLIDQYVGQLKG